MFVRAEIDLESGFVSGFTQDGLTFSVCLESDKSGHRKIVHRSPMHNGSIWGLAGESNCKFFERHPDSADIALLSLAEIAGLVIID